MVRKGTAWCIVAAKGVEVHIKARRGGERTLGGVQPCLLLEVEGKVSQAGGGHGDECQLRRKQSSHPPILSVPPIGHEDDVAAGNSQFFSIVFQAVKATACVTLFWTHSMSASHSCHL